MRTVKIATQERYVFDVISDRVQATHERFTCSDPPFSSETSIMKTSKGNCKAWQGLLETGLYLQKRLLRHQNVDPCQVFSLPLLAAKLGRQPFLGCGAARSFKLTRVIIVLLELPIKLCLCLTFHASEKQQKGYLRLGCKWPLTLPCVQSDRGPLLLSKQAAVLCCLDCSLWSQLVHTGSCSFVL